MADRFNATHQTPGAIARQLLPQGDASQLDEAANAIAAANGVSTITPLNGAITIPDRFQGQVGSDPTVRDGARRLSQPAAPTHPALALAQAQAKLLELDMGVSHPERTPVGAPVHKEIAGVPTKITTERFEGVKTWLDESALLTTRMDFGKLTRAQFDTLHARYGGLSQVPYQPDREYELIDFLPPFLQATVNVDVEIPEMQVLRGSEDIGFGATLGEEKKVGATVNCHGLAYPATRAYQGQQDQVDFLYGEMVHMDEMTDDRSLFTKVAEFSADQLDQLAAFDLQPGDMIQLHEVSDWARITMLLHSATHVGDGLFFEKPNTEGAEVDQPELYISQEETPIRLATLENMIKPVSAAVDGQFRIEVLRASAPLPPAEEAFQSSMEDEIRRLATSQGKSLQTELVAELEQNMGGGIRAEYASALITKKLDIAESGRGQLGA